MTSLSVSSSTPPAPDSYILSIDVGIINFAFCLLRCSSALPNAEPEIVLWENIDLRTQLHPPVVAAPEIGICVSANKRGIRCKRRPVYFREQGGRYEKEWCCKTHTPNTVFQASDINRATLMRLTRAEADRKLLNAVCYAETIIPPPPIAPSQFKAKGAVVDAIINTLAPHVYTPVPSAATERKTLAKATTVDAGNMSVPMLALQLHTILIPLLETYPIHYVAVENQMNTRMKSVQDMLVMLFTMRGVNPNSINEAPHVVPYICPVSAKNKLKGYEAYAQAAYGDRKRSSEEIVEAMIAQTYPQWQPFWQSHEKKQNDLSDALLQGLWFASKGSGRPKSLEVDQENN